MTAKELINMLNKLPSDMRVVVRGYEEGYNDIIKLRPLKLKPSGENKWYYGEYFEDDSDSSLEAIELYGENTTSEEI